MITDLRSDTFTKPTPAMLETMFKAPVGDDVFGEDPSVNRLEDMAAQMFGMQAALFCPSGTMTNQIAIKCHTQPGDEVICEKLSSRSSGSFARGPTCGSSSGEVRGSHSPRDEMSAPSAYVRPS